MLRASGISQSSAIRTTISFQRHRALVSPLYVRTFQLLSILLFCQTRARIYLVSPLFASSVARFLLQQMRIMGHHAILLSCYSHPDDHPPDHFSFLLRPHRPSPDGMIVLIEVSPRRDDSHCVKETFDMATHVCKKRGFNTFRGKYQSHVIIVVVSFSMAFHIFDGYILTRRFDHQHVCDHDTAKRVLMTQHQQVDVVQNKSRYELVLELKTSAMLLHRDRPRLAKVTEVLEGSLHSE